MISKNAAQCFVAWSKMTKRVLFFEGLKQGMKTPSSCRKIKGWRSEGGKDGGRDSFAVQLTVMRGNRGRRRVGRPICVVLEGSYPGLKNKKGYLCTF